MVDPGPMVNAGYGPHPELHEAAMLESMVFVAVVGLNDPLPVTTVPVAGRVIVSNGDPETIGAVPPL
jgi:hypothetical protein